MHTFIQALLIIFHFWTFCLAPSLQAGSNSYRPEVGIFEDQNILSDKQIYTTSHHQSRLHGTDMKIHAQRYARIVSSILSGDRGEFPAEELLEVLDCFNTYSHVAHTESRKKNWYGGSRKSSGHEQYSSATSLPSVFDFKEKVAIPSSGYATIEMKNPQFNTPELEIIFDMARLKGATPPQLMLKAGYTLTDYSCVNTSSNFFRNSINMERRLNKYYQLPTINKLTVTTINNDKGIKPRIIADTIVSQAMPSFLQELGKDNQLELNLAPVHNVYIHESHRQSQLSQQFALLVGLTITALTYGVGSSLVGPLMIGMNANLVGTVGCMVGTAISKTATDISLSVLNKGNLSEAFSSEKLRSLGKAMISTMLINGGAHGEFLDRAAYASVQSGVNTVLDVAMDNRSFEDALKDNFISGAVSLGSGYAAQWIGQAYKGEKAFLNYGTHKLAHGFLGGLTAKVLNKDVFSGAVGAIIGEIYGEWQMNRLLEQVQSGDLKPEQMNTEIQKVVNQASLISGTTASLMDRDVGIASQTAGNAVENNAAVYGLAIAKVMWEIYALTHEDEIERTKEEVCEYVAEKTGVSPKLVAITYDSLMFAVSTGRAVKEGGKYLFKKVTQQTVKSRFGNLEIVDKTPQNPIIEKKIVFNQPLKFKDKETFLKQTEGCFKTPVEANNAWHSYQRGESFTIHRKGGMELTVRPNQEYRIKIHGTPQVTGRSPNRDKGHAFHTLKETSRVSKRSDVDYVQMDLGINRMLSKQNQFGPKGNIRNDVAYKTNDGKINQIEVQSRTDKVQNLREKMDYKHSELPEGMQGGRMDVIERLFNDK